MKNNTPRKEAQSLGLKRYQGAPCPKGHSGVRYVTSMDCVECRAFLKAMASRRKRSERGPVKLGRKRKYPELIGPPKPTKKQLPKPITQFDFWVRRNRIQRSERRLLSIDYYQTIFVTHCPLLGIELTYENCGTKSVPNNYATLDRIDPTKGYVEGNVQILSFRANTIKGDTTLEELRLIIKNWEKHLPVKTK